MSDARWTEVDEDMAAAAGHLARSVELFAAGGFAGEKLDAYRARMAFMHAMQSGHTSLEAALLRILDLLGEEAPSGRDWHADLIRRAARPLAGRPAILAQAVADAANETGASAMWRCAATGCSIHRWRSPPWLRPACSPPAWRTPQRRSGGRWTRTSRSQATSGQADARVAWVKRDAA